MLDLYVDTSVWVAFVDGTDPLHGRAKSIIKGHRSYTMVSNELILSETVTLLRREVGPDVAAAFGEDFLDAKTGVLLATMEQDWRQALRIIKKYREHKISAADATSAVMIRRLKIEKAASFDKHFRILLPDIEVLGLPG